MTSHVHHRGGIDSHMSAIMGSKFSGCQKNSHGLGLAWFAGAVEISGNARNLLDLLPIRHGNDLCGRLN